MRKIVSTLLIFFVSLQLSAQTDYLEPVKDLNTYTGELGEYYRNVFSLLYTNFQKKPVVRFAVLPSFSPEYAMSVEMKAGKYYLMSNTLSQSYWQAGKGKVKVVSQSVPISKSFYLSLTELFRLATGQIQDLDGYGGGFDGSTYYFSATGTNGKAMMGQKWSPSSGTLMERLVQICETSYLLSTGKKISEASIASQTNILIKDLQSRAKKFPDEYKKPKYAGAFRLGAQIKSTDGKEIEGPVFPCMKPESYVIDRVIYPETLLAKNIQGYVVCEFTIDEGGHAVRPRILKSSHPNFAEEVLRVINGMPEWIPALKEYIPLVCTYIIYIPFRSQIYRVEKVKKDKEELAIQKGELWVTPEFVPEFPGGMNALNLFLKDNIRYPEKLKGSGKEGRVICQFTIDKWGFLKNFKVARSGGDATFDEEALRVIRLLPRWKPGGMCNIPNFISTVYTIPVIFKP